MVSGISSIISTYWHITVNHFSIIFRKIGKEHCFFFYPYRTLNIHCNNVKKRLSTKLRASDDVLINEIAKA